MGASPFSYITTEGLLFCLWWYNPANVQKFCVQRIYLGSICYLPLLCLVQFHKVYTKLLLEMGDANQTFLFAPHAKREDWMAI